MLVMRADGRLVGSLGLPPGSDAPAWSPNGKQLVFSRALSVGGRINRDLYVADVLSTPAGPRAGHPTRFTVDRRPDHSPDWQRRPGTRDEPLTSGLASHPFAPPRGGHRLGAPGR